MPSLSSGCRRRTVRGHEGLFHVFGVFGTSWGLLSAFAFVRWSWSADGRFERRRSVRHAARVTGLVIAVVLPVLAYGSLIEPRLELDPRALRIALEARFSCVPPADSRNSSSPALE